MNTSPQHTPETVKLTPEEEAARKKRGLMITLTLFIFVILVFAITVNRLGATVNDVADTRNFEAGVAEIQGAAVPSENAVMAPDAETSETSSEPEVEDAEQ